MGKRDFSDLALRLALDLWGLEDLHFGYWDGLEVRPENLRAAQKQYTEVFLSHIPTSVRSVLDVGCGTGTIARLLLDRGFRVEALAPDPELVARARERLKGEAAVHVSEFEKFETGERFDLVLMPESCQYVGSRPGLGKAAAVLAPGGYLLIADVFRHRRWPRDKPYVSKAGHNIDRFLRTAEENGFVLEERLNITDQVGPTITLYDEFLRTKAIPVAEAGVEVLRRAHPWAFLLLSKLYGEKLRHIRERYRHQGLEAFREYRFYLVLRFRKQPVASARAPCP